MNRYTSIFAALTLASAGAFAQENPLSNGTKTLYGMVKGNLIKAAEKMPEENYSFKPTPEVRSFGQIVGHVADAQIMFCSAAKGEQKSPDAEKTKKSKADLVGALKDAVAYCDAVYNAMNDSAAQEKVKFFGREWPKLTILEFNVAHDNEHYGNIVTYMRLKSLVPPSSENTGR
jgi:uncharacterized damage-inducible protein DinB